MSALLVAAQQVLADRPDLQAEARQLIAPFAQALQSTVKQAMETGGPVAAVQACQTLAPEIASRHSQQPWTVARTALKVRNPDNAPDEWEQSVLAQFKEDLSQGKAMTELSYGEVVGGEYRYMQAIGTGEACVSCHGQNIKPEIQAILAKQYPKDQATGFAVGDLRGAFSLRRALE